MPIKLQASEGKPSSTRLKVINNPLINLLVLNLFTVFSTDDQFTVPNLLTVFSVVYLFLKLFCYTVDNVTEP